MGNTPIQMGLKTDKQYYHSGEIMTGTVYISVTQVTPAIQQYQGIRLQFIGQENTEVRVEERTGSGNDRTTSYRTCRESSNILRVEVPMMNFASPLRVAKYEFPFEWKLPDHNTPLPSSFRHRVPCDSRRGCCEVRYTLSAYLVPQPETNNSIFGVVPNSMMNSSSSPGSNGSTSASQRIHFMGAPTRSIPEPIHIGEERTVMNGFCCCWKQGHVSLGWEVDSIVMTPDAPCNLQIWGSNSSALPVQNLRVQLIQSVKWQAGSDYDRQHHTRNSDSTLIDYSIDVSHLPQWDPVIPSSRRRQQRGGDYHPAATTNDNNNDTSLQQQFHYNNNYDDEDDEQHEPVATSFQVPSDIMDSYRGLNCTVEHTLVVSAVTRMMATTPQVSYKVHLQRNPAGAAMAMAAAATTTAAGAGLPVATAWMEEPEYTDIVLPADWRPDEKVPVIHLREITAMDAGVNNHVGGPGVGGAATTAQAIVMDPPVNPSVAAAALPTMNPPSVAMHPSMMVHPSAPIESKPGYDPSARAPPTVAAYPTAPSAPPVTAYSTAPPAPVAASVTPTNNNNDDDDHAMDFARPVGMTDEDIATPMGGISMTATSASPAGGMVEGQFTDLQEFQNLLKQINPNDMGTYRRVEQQIRSLPSCQRVLSTMTPEDYQYLCQVGTPLSIARISYLLASELNKGRAQGFQGAFLVALMQLPVAQETSISLIGSLTELISDLEQSSEYVQQSLRPEDAKWFKQRVDEWAY